MPFWGRSKQNSKDIARLDEALKAIADRLDLLKERVDRVYADINSLRSPAWPAPVPDTDDLEDHKKLLKRSAGIAYVRLSCHRDTWDFLVAKAADTEHFRLPGITKQREGCLVDVDVSGRALIAILEALRKTANAPGDVGEGTRSIAQKAYRRMSKALKRATATEAKALANGKKKQEEPDPVVHINIDDRPAAA